MIMDILEKSKQYAQGKALEAITSAIEKAYADGYNACLKDLEKETTRLFENGVEYVDLQLPSGTLWSSHNLVDKENTLQLLTYGEAEKMSIPDEKQFEELIKYCQIGAVQDNKKEYIATCFYGRNGKHITIYYGSTKSGPHTFPNTNYKFWLKNTTIEDENNRKCAYYKDSSIFMGDRIPVMLVKSPNRILPK